MVQKIILTSINLTQFDDYRNCPWVSGLISLSSDFFSKRKVINATLFLESSSSTSLDAALTMLSEASSMDFKYKTYKSGSIREIEALFKGVVKYT